MRRAFLRVSSTALRLMSPAVTKHPCFATWIDTTPDPQPTSRTFSSGRTSRDSMRSTLSSDGGYTSSSVDISIPGSYCIGHHSKSMVTRDVSIMTVSRSNSFLIFCARSSTKSPVAWAMMNTRVSWPLTTSLPPA